MSDGPANLEEGDDGVAGVRDALQELDDELRAAADATRSATPVVQGVFEARRLLEQRTERRIRFLRALKRKRTPPLNRDDPRVVELFNELLRGAARLSDYEFQLKAHELVNRNWESQRPLASAYVEEMLDAVDEKNGHARRRVAELILKPTPHERADPASRLREFFMYVDRERFSAWKAALAEQYGKNVKILWKEHRNPYRPGNMHDSLRL